MHNIEFLNDAAAQIKKLVNDVLEENPTDPSKVKDFVEDLDNTFLAIRKNPTSGDPVEETSYKDIRCIHLQRFNSIRVMYRIGDNDTILIIAVIVFWLAT